MTEDQLYEIAQIVDNDYNGTRKTFTAKRYATFWSLTTNVCDSASLIRVYETNNKISTIERLGPDTERWQPITSATWGKIEKYLDSINSSQLNTK